MPSMDLYRRMLGSSGSTIGQVVKANSDFEMEATWDNNIQSKIAYIYDYYHDDQPDKNYGMTYEKTTKTPIDIKFIISEYGSLSKDQPSAKIMFKPSQKTHFDKGDELYYLEEYCDRYGLENPFIGKYIDIPDEKGVYHKWMICLQDIQGNQFQKYQVLPCGYKLQWIRKDGNKRIKQEMWCVLRSQSSYNSGLWTDYSFTTRENQEIIFIQTNPISDTIWYISEDNNANQRLIVDVPCENPNVWQVSKVEKVNVRGKTKVTLYQTEGTSNDYIEKDANGKIIGMWADYYSSNVEVEDNTTTPTTSIYAEITATNNTIKVGGSYKLLTIKFYDKDGIEITDRYSDSISKDNWKCYIDDVDYTDSESISWLSQSDFNKIKIKVADDSSLLSKLLTVKCSVNDIVGQIQFEMLA